MERTVELNFDTGIVEMNVNGVRTIRVNPSDVGFLETLYTLMGKIDAIDKDINKKKGKSDDPGKLFDIHRAGDKRMREAVDSVFGDGFCADVFQGVRLLAITESGMTALENFIYAVIDQMDDSTKESLSKRSDSVSKYTAKYQKYHTK